MKLLNGGVRGGGADPLASEPVESGCRGRVETLSSLLLTKEPKADLFRQSQLPQKLLDVSRYQERFDQKVNVPIFILLIYLP